MLEVPCGAAKMSARSSTSARTRAETPEPVRRARLINRTVLPWPLIAASRSGVSRAIPRVETCCGVVRASKSTLASAAVLAAESHPSTSKAPPASVIPIARAAARPSSNDPPRSIVSTTTLDVELSAPTNPSTLTPGIVWRHKLKTGAPSITADSNRKTTPARAATSRKSAYAWVIGPLLAVTTCMPRANAARMCEMAGSPLVGSSVVSSTATSAPAASRNSSMEPARGPNSGSLPSPFGSAAVPCRSVWMPVMLKGNSRRWFAISRPSARPTFPYPMSASFKLRF